MSELDFAPQDTEKARRRLRSRRAKDLRFRYYGLSAIIFAILALLVLVSAIGMRAFQASTYHNIVFDLYLDPTKVIPEGTQDPAAIERNIEGFYAVVMDDLERTFPLAASDPAQRTELGTLITRLAVQPLAIKTSRSPSLIGRNVAVDIPISDELDLYLKQPNGYHIVRSTGIITSVSRVDPDIVTLTGDSAFAQLVAASKSVAELSGREFQPSVLLNVGPNFVRVVDLGTASISGELLTGSATAFEGQAATGRIMYLPESERLVSDRTIAWAVSLRNASRIESKLHTSLLLNTDSTQPELAGALAAIIGSLLTMLVVATVSIPVGIFASIYLEEFAPRNRITSLIEVNINNLAAVPSIVFGLLGAAVFLRFLDLPRSVPLVGGLVLALLVLPVVIIASRAALRAVPDSVRTGALAVGASKMQAVFHHVLPLAAPGMLTGAILAMARALGETAPLLLIGMVAFVADVPSGVMDESTALPVLIYSWATNAERAWEPMTAAAIVVLLAIMVVMNGIVVFLRRRFERRM